MQYGHARIAGILRNAEKKPDAAARHAELAREERDLIKRLAEFPVVVREATERRAPHAVPIYAIRVADDFHRFYHDHRILGESDDVRRGVLIAVTKVMRQQLTSALGILGINVPEQM